MASKNPKVLVGIVTYDGKHYIFPQCYKAMTQFDYPDYEWIIVDNSATDSYATKLRREGYQKVHHIKRASNSRDTLSDSQNYIRKYFLAGDYDYLLLLESDLLPPKNTITKLMDHNALVVGSFYLIGHEVKVPCIFFLDQKKDNPIVGTRLIRYQEIMDYYKKGLKKVHGVGFGCTLMRRDIISRFAFWTDERFANKHSDVYFYLQLQNAGIPVFVDTDLIVPHYPSKWDDVADR